MLRLVFMECIPPSKYFAQVTVAECAAKIAGEIIVKGSLSGKNSSTVCEKSGVDLVTAIDKEAEKAIVAEIIKNFPNDVIIGEEDASMTGENASKQSEPIPSDKPVWCIDPLDGTTNFVHGYPFVNVSIGYCVDGIPCVGVIYNPFLKEMYQAEKGNGAYLNGKRIQVDTNASTLADCFLVNNIGHIRDDTFVQDSSNRVNKWLNHGLRALRMSGSAAQNMAHVASGVVTCYYEHGYGGPWDVAAGMIIVSEAGGFCLNAFTKEPFVLTYGKGSICCGNETIIHQVLQVAEKPKFLF